MSDARNPLASVARITEHENTVQFGPKKEDNDVFNSQNWGEINDGEERSDVGFQRAG